MLEGDAAAVGLPGAVCIDFALLPTGPGGRADVFGGKAVDDGFRRGNKRKSWSTSRSNETVATALRGFKTMSQPGGIAARCSRKTSRNRRFTRLRSTALPSARGVVIPNRLCGSPLEM